MINILDNPTNKRVFIKITVAPKIKQYASYMTYEITIETNDPSFANERSLILRRYSEFRIIHRMLEKQFPFVQIPEIPPKAPFKRAFDLAFVEKRKEALELYLAKLLTKKIYLSSRAFHLFLQSSLPMSEIKDIVEGKTADVKVDRDIVIHAMSSPLKDDESTHLISSTDDENENSVNMASSQEASSFVSNSPAGSKRVSFCDQVTVAEIHASWVNC